MQNAIYDDLQHDMDISQIQFVEKLTDNGVFETWKASLDNNCTCFAKTLKGM